MPIHVSTSVMQDWLVALIVVVCVLAVAAVIAICVVSNTIKTGLGDLLNSSSNTRFTRVATTNNDDENDADGGDFTHLQPSDNQVRFNNL